MQSLIWLKNNSPVWGNVLAQRCCPGQQCYFDALSMGGWGMRLIAAAIVMAGALIAGSIALASHYSIVSIGAGRLGAYRLNQWTGEIVWCWHHSGVNPPDRIECTALADTWVPVQK